MKRFLIALGFAVLIEVMLGLVFLQFGKAGLGRSGERNWIGTVITGLHAPGYLMAKGLGIPKQFGLLFIASIAVIQWMGVAIAWMIIRNRTSGAKSSAEK
ncbi:MAG TPA: hypothetical protein VMZ27_15465 [Candidatus Saccharimonadales bacterium]|nr:hypothetical protein [Candidatus Saccharimonadales bacterium]